MAKRVLALMLAVLAVFVFGSFSELTGAESRHGGGHSGGYRGGHSGGYRGGHRGSHSGYHGGGYHGYRTYYGSYSGCYYGGCLSYEPFWGGNVYYTPGYYSYPVPAPQDIPPRRCQILENGEWKDIPCK